MRDLLILFVHFDRHCGPTGSAGRHPFGCCRSHAGAASTAGPQSWPQACATNLHTADRIIAGLCTLLMRRTRVLRSAILLKPSTLLASPQRAQETTVPDVVF